MSDTCSTEIAAQIQQIVQELLNSDDMSEPEKIEIIKIALAMATDQR